MQEISLTNENLDSAHCKHCAYFNAAYSFCNKFHRETVEWLKCPTIDTSISQRKCPV